MVFLMWALASSCFPYLRFYILLQRSMNRFLWCRSPDQMSHHWFFMHNVETEKENTYAAGMAIRKLEILGKWDLGIQHFLDPPTPVLYFCQLKERVSLHVYVIWLEYGMGLLHCPFTARIFAVTYSTVNFDGHSPDFSTLDHYCAVFLPF